MLLAVLLTISLAQTPPTGVVRGVVVDGRDGTPIRKVSVRVQGGSTTITGDDGRFEIVDAPAGTQELYVSVVDFILVKRTVTVPAGSAIELTIPIAAGTGTYTETVTVRPVETSPVAAGSGVSTQTLSSSEMQQLRGTITNDPFRAVQSLPGVAASDDLRSEFTVRGNAIDHMNFTFEGVAAPLLVHTVQGIHDSGSIAMVNGDVLDDIVLFAGSYPQRFGGRTGAELDFRMREGSRDGTRSHVSVSLTDAGVVLEGPLGRSHRGSWLASGRKSYLDRLIRRLDPRNDFAFGFSDVQGKLVYDVNSRHQVQFALTAGHSRLDRLPDNLGTGEVKDGRNATAVAVATWRYTPSPRLVITHKLAGSANTFRNVSKDQVELARGTAGEAVYRVDVSYMAGPHVTFDGGGHIGRSAAMKARDFSAHAFTESAYAEGRIAAGSAFLVAGGRVDRWPVTGATKVSPWFQVEQPFGHSITLRAGGGLYRQPPYFQQLFGFRGTRNVAPEQAAQFDVAVAGHLSRSTTWQISGYDREDRDLIRLANAEFRLVDGRLVGPSPATVYHNSLNGHSRGIEALVHRRSLNGLSGWLAYSLAYTRYHDRFTGESFWGDWDERHTVNAYGSYRFTDRFSASTRLHYGSNFPAAGYWEAQGDRYFVSALRNEVRVKPYSRLDLRLNRTFTWQQKRLTLFIEAINLYDRNNERAATPGINSRTFEVFGLFDKLFPRIPSAGCLLEF